MEGCRFNPPASTLLWLEDCHCVEFRFQATPETFVDPTSNRRMRVYVDGATGDRRYVAED